MTILKKPEYSICFLKKVLVLKVQPMSNFDMLSWRALFSIISKTRADCQYVLMFCYLTVLKLLSLPLVLVNPRRCVTLK